MTNSEQLNILTLPDVPKSCFTQEKVTEPEIRTTGYHKSLRTNFDFA